MKIRIHIDKKNALRAGSDQHGHHVVDIPAASLTPAQQEYLSRWGHSSTAKIDADFYLDEAETRGKPRGYGYQTVPSPRPLTTTDLDQVRALLDALIERQAAWDREAREAQLETLALAEQYQRDPQGIAVSVNLYTGRVSLDGRELPNDHPCRLHLLAKAQATAEAEEMEREEQTRQQQAEKEAARKRLHEWAVVQGSPLLRARIEEGLNWQALADTWMRTPPRGFRERRTSTLTR